MINCLKDLDLTDIFQILFYIVIGLITTLTFFQARKTIFMPIKTETYKLQVDKFQEILRFFLNKSNDNFFDIFDFPNIVNTNSSLMYTDFIHSFYNDQVKVDLKRVKEWEKKFDGIVVTQNWVDKNVKTIDFLSTEEEKEFENKSFPLPENWKDYKYEMIGHTKEYSQRMNELENLLYSPIIPKGLREKISKFKELIESNLFIVGETLTEISQLLPTKFPDADSTLKMTTEGIWNKFHENSLSFDGTTQEILKYIEDYLKTNELYN